MKIIGFVGPSGTGKSHRAMWVAKEQGILYIIDDGLLIKGNSIVAGNSAKKEKSKIASVKHALFVDSEQAREMANAIKANNPDSILILGTSEEMIKKVSATLELPMPSQYINIKDVASKEEIEKAKFTREKQGKHVIPVPTFEVKKHFSGYFVDPLKIFKKDKSNITRFVADKSVVRPKFSYLGDYFIEDRVIHQICTIEAGKSKEVVRVSRITSTTYPEFIDIRVEVILGYGFPMQQACGNIQRNIKRAVEEYTALNVRNINVFVKSIER